MSVLLLICLQLPYFLHYAEICLTEEVKIMDESRNISLKRDTLKLGSSYNLKYFTFLDLKRKGYIKIVLRRM